MTRSGVFGLLRRLAEPLAALAVVLLIWATVIPVVARADGTWCIGTIGGLAPEAWATPICDHCVPVVLPDAAVPILAAIARSPLPAAGRVPERPSVLLVALTRIRDPPPRGNEANPNVFAQSV
ncbi:hypothetical protein L1787_23210 [Acuticoccus sp. M5D2P5]|uniref:hypothetical protein n=1 Tax=Acuticoccus kalidii TaxID=2910977 RepID=UPI001F2BCCBB|nr:hypothetical protein [Acuticoccus kalidii]MCF3936307.1 hypothetical protein [Acuticoccus kalidii]